MGDSGGGRIVTLACDDYPPALRALHDPPLALWMQGELAPQDRVALSIVGPRRPSAYGHRQAQRFASGLGRMGITSISGLARGIDGVVHQASLDAGARTVAVIGSGLGKLYPAEHEGLAQRIRDGNGAVISELPWHTPPSPSTFPPT